MGRPLASGVAAASSIPTAAAFLLALAVLLAASEQHPRSPNATDVHGAGKKGSRQPPVNREPLGQHRSSPQRMGAWRVGNATSLQESQLKPRALLPDSALASDDAAASRPRDEAAISVRYISGEVDEEKNESALCLGCPGGTGGETAQPQEPLLGNPYDQRPMEALAAATSLARPLHGQDEAWKAFDSKEGPGSQEDVGSGDQHAEASPSQGTVAGWTAVPPTAPLASSPAGRGLSSDSAETDLLLNTVGVAVLPSPTLGGPTQVAGEEAGRVPDPDSAQKEEPLELWVDSTSSLPAGGAQGHTDLTWLNTEAPRLAATPPVKTALTPKPSPDPLASEIIDIDYYDMFDGESLVGVGPDSTKRKPPDDKEMLWSLHDLYDDFTPFDESDFYPTTSFYTDGDEEDLEEPEEEEEEEDGVGGLAGGLEDENDSRIPTPATPKLHTMVQEAESTSRRYVVPPLQTFIVSGGGHGAATPRPRPAEIGRDLSLFGGSENGTECRSGYIRHNNSCKSVCETFPSYCHNGGQCYLVENLGAFCRCNTQDYIWHKGMRCESIITDFQVMCVAVGSAALVVLLLFMMTVFFAKKLYLLKTENSKLRKTKYRTPSELHNDNFSLSTIAEGSHPNDDPNAPHKLQDPLKSCQKEEESFNIQNSMSPKLDNSKGDPDDSEVNCLQNNLT